MQAAACCQACWATLFVFIYVYAFRLVVDCQPSQVPTAALPLHSTLACTPSFHAVCVFFPYDSYGLAHVSRLRIRCILILLVCFFVCFRALLILMRVYYRGVASIVMPGGISQSRSGGVASMLDISLYMSTVI